MKKQTSYSPRLLLLLVMAVMALFTSASTASDDIDGPLLRGTSTYGVQATILDYSTLGSVGFTGRITITRGSFYNRARDVWANTNESYGVTTSVSNRTYKITCQYRGLTATRYVTAPRNGYRFAFKYAFNPYTGRGSLNW